MKPEISQPAFEQAMAELCRELEGKGWSRTEVDNWALREPKPQSYWAKVAVADDDDMTAGEARFGHLEYLAEELKGLEGVPTVPESLVQAMARAQAKAPTARLTWERYQTIQVEAFAELPADVEERVLQGPLFNGFEREWYTRMEQKTGMPAEQMWLEDIEAAIERLEEHDLPVPAVLRSVPRPQPRGTAGRTEKPTREKKSSSMEKHSKPERPASGMDAHLQQGGFTRISNAVVDQLMPVMSDYVWKALCFCYRLASKGGSFHVGYARIGQAIGHQDRSGAIRAMAQLIEAGLLVRVRTGAPGYTSHYQLVDLTTVDFEHAKAVLSKRRAHRDEV